VPVYADTTREAVSVVFVPIGGAEMKPYERPRNGPLAGTVGTSTPSWPVQVASDVARPVGTTGAVSAPAPAGSIGTVAAPPPPPRRTAIQSVPRPTRNSGVSVFFDGARWVSAGPAVPYSPSRFVPIGDHHGFPVYRAIGGDDRTIYVTVVADGPVAPYSRR
jgi:hypothetical protein